MKTLYIECNMGAAGDMLSAALAELLPDPAAFTEKLNSLGIPGVVYRLEPSVKCGITGSHMTVTVNGEEEEPGEDHPHDHHHGHDHEHEHDHEHDHDHEHEHHHDHDHDYEHHHDHEHEHDHDHSHHHHHSSLHDIGHIVRDHLDLPEKVREDVMAVYGLIAEAESAVHGVPVDEIHFHEVGTMDAVADITAVCLAMAELAPDEVVVSPVHVGSGNVRCAHGILPVPTPATARILTGVPIYGGGIRGELCTPTGAALLKHFAARFGDMPVMRIEKTGFGMGKKDFEAANCVRAFIGETENKTGDAVLLACNLDDMTAEEIGFAMERMFDAGALDCWTVPAGMKKNRPGTVFSVLCRPEDADGLAAAIFCHTTTIGIRELPVARRTLERSVVTRETASGPVREKRSTGYGVTRTKPEFEDLAKIARETGRSLFEVRAELDGKN